MVDTAWTREWQRITASGEQPSLAAACAEAVKALSACGAGVALFPAPDLRLLGYATDKLSLRFEQTQLAAGEGPCVDAYRERRPMVVRDLKEHQTRWPGFAPEAAAAGLRAVFAFPLVVGEIRFGALDVYRTTPGGVTDRQVAEGERLARVVSLFALDAVPGPPPVVSQVVVGSGGCPPAVHAAAGMVAERLGLRVPDALVRIRAHAYVHGIPLGQVAREILSGLLLLED